MRAQPVAAEILAAAFFDAVDRQAGSICGNDCAGRAMNFHAREQRALNFEIFGDCFNNPIGFRAPIEIVFKISGDDSLRESWSEKSGGPRFQRGFESSARDAIADFGTRERQASRFFRGVQFGGNDIQQKSFHAGIREMRCDSRAHRACAKNHRAIDSFFHGRCA